MIKDGEPLQIDEINDNDLVISYKFPFKLYSQYNLGYQETKDKEVNQLLDKGYKLSFGGTVFADGVGVPDCVLNGFKDALKLK